MVHYKATIEYDGTAFHGFQRQRDARSVQGVLEAALTRLQGGEAVGVRGAGRTDSGVHATGQVVDFHHRWRNGVPALWHAANALLPDDVAVRSLTLAPTGFHPRYDALSRRYRYTLLNTPQRHPLLHRTSFHVPRALDGGAMEAALQHLLGEHDFATFGRATTASESMVRTMLSLEVWREGALLHVELEATGFLNRMVRSIVGTLLPVGRGERPPGWLGELLAARDRARAGTTIAPTGLCLIAVRYPGSSTDEMSLSN